MVLIPAAGRVAEGVMALSNIGCPAMVPSPAGRSSTGRCSYLRSLGLRRFVIAVSRRGMFVEDFVECSFGQDCEISFIVPSADGGVGRTVLELAEQAKGDSALVVLGDTHFQFADPAILLRDEPAVLVQAGRRLVSLVYRRNRTPTGIVTALHDKEPDLPGPLQALIGVYYFPKLAELRDAARAAVAQVASASARRTELAADSRERRADAADSRRAGRRLARLRQSRPSGQLASHAAAKARVQRAVDRQRAGHGHQAQPLRRKVPRRDQLPAAAAARAGRAVSARASTIRPTGKIPG